MAAPNTYSLLADIGGTNTRVALAEGTRLLPDSVQKFRNADFPGIGAVLERFLEGAGHPDCRGACVAGAGPVRDGALTLTNLDWTIDAETIGRAAKAETVAVLNDLQAQGHALGYLPESSLTQVVEGTAAPDPQASMLVIGIGTGFNCAPVYAAPGGRFVPPAEAGHANLPIRSEAELELCQTLEDAHGFPSVEEVLSGRGLKHLDAFFARRAGTPRELGSDEIIAAASEGDPVAEETLRGFVRILGTVTGNLALIHLPFGGIYLIGGMARAVTPWFETMGYGDAIRDKGRFAGFMRNFSVHVIDDDFAALTGGAHHLQGLL